MRSVVFCIFVCACGGASSARNVTIATPPPAEPVTTVNASIATPPPSAVHRPASIPGTNITFAGGDGTDAKNAIVIHGAKGEMDGVAAEYKYLEMLHGQRGVDFNVGSQALLEDGGRSFDKLDVTLKDGTNLAVFFDITEYFGKF